MAFVVKVLALVVVVMATVRASHAAVYKVQDFTGGTTVANVDYKQWVASATKNFQVGHTIPPTPSALGFRGLNDEIGHSQLNNVGSDHDQEEVDDYRSETTIYVTFSRSHYYILESDIKDFFGRFGEGEAVYMQNVEKPLAFPPCFSFCFRG